MRLLFIVWRTELWRKQEIYLLNIFRMLFFLVIFVHVLWNNQLNTDKQTRKNISSYPTILAYWFNSMSTLSVSLRSIFYILPVSVVKELSWESRRGQTNFEIIKINVSIRLITMKKDRKIHILLPPAFQGRAIFSHRFTVKSINQLKPVTA